MKCIRCNKNIMPDEIIHARENGSWSCDDIFYIWSKKELIDKIRNLEKQLREVK